MIQFINPSVMIEVDVIRHMQKFIVALFEMAKLRPTETRSQHIYAPNESLYLCKRRIRIVIHCDHMNELRRPPAHLELLLPDPNMGGFW